jgi:hypothetical protein
MSPLPSRMAAPAAARSSYSGTPLRPRDHRFHRPLAEHAGLAHSAALLAVDDDQLVHSFSENELRVGQRPPQHVVLADRQIVGVPRRSRRGRCACALGLLLKTLDHHLGISPAAAVAHVGQGIGRIRAGRLRRVPPMEKISVGSPSSGTST